MRASLSTIAGILHADLEGSDARCTGISIDSRTLEAGDLFVAVRGERFDGHDFLQQARDRGAAGALVCREVRAPLPVIRVHDTQRTLGALGRWWRMRHAPDLVAVTGANGKTTVKEMIAAACRRAGETLATRGNRNNELGVPLTLLELETEHRYAVIEMGANQPGEIDRLAAMALPRIGVVTNSGAAHLEGFGSQEGAARAEGGELLARLPTDGVAVINADDRYAGLWRELAGSRRVLGFGAGPEADVRVREGSSVAMISTPVGAIDFWPGLPGRHNLVNAAAAVAAALALELSPAAIRTGLESVRPVPGRLSPQRTAAGYELIDDSYNANPQSLAAAVDYLVSRGGEAWLVLGEMAELGTEAPALHQEAGRAAKRAGVTRLFTVGDAAQPASEGFGAGAEHFRDSEALVSALRDALHPGVCCLVKGSRRAAMEHVVQALLASNNHNGAFRRASGGA